MKINFFNRSFEFSIRKREKMAYETKEKPIRNKVEFRVVVFLIMILSFFVLSIYKTGLNTYKIGDIAPRDIIAYKDVEYTRDILDDDLKIKIRQNVKPEYDKIEEVSQEELDKLDQFFQNINQLDLTNDKEIKEFIRSNSFNLTVDEVKTIGISKSVKYYIFLADVLREIYEIGIPAKDNFNKILAEKQIILTDYEKKLLLNFIKPNIKINKEKTLDKIEKNMESLRNNKVEIKKGDTIVKANSVITSTEYDNLAALGYVNKSDSIKKAFGQILIYIIISILFYNFGVKFLKNGFSSKGFYPVIITMAIINTINLIFVNDPNFIYLSPLLLLPVIGLTLTRDILFTIAVVSFNYVYTVNDINWAIIVTLLSLFVIHTNISVTNRNELVKNSIYIGIIQALVVMTYGLYLDKELSEIVANMLQSLSSGLLVGIFSLGLLPYFENTFQILTDIKMLELSNFSNDLLKQLLLVAPGTFYHSLMVGTLSEAGAEAVGANSILCRVASYYHDIGKMQRPMYFVENQQGRPNPHNDLKPSLSALIIISHRKDGYILGKSYGLPQEILDVILEHHGTTLVQYFYYQALENNEKVVENDFRYPGPKPKSKESGIILLADTIEAAVRANSDKSEENIEKLVRNLIKAKLDDGQLSECNITLEEIEKVTKAFLRVIRGIYHERIQYIKDK